MAKTLGQVAVQEMTHVSTGPSGLHWEQTLHRGDRSSQEEGRVWRVPPAARGPGGPALDTWDGWCLAQPTGAAQSTLAGEGPRNRGAMPPGPGGQDRPVHPAPSPAATHTSWGLQHLAHAQAAEHSELTSRPGPLRASTLPRSRPPNQYIELRRKAFLDFPTEPETPGHVSDLETRSPEC